MAGQSAGYGGTGPGLLDKPTGPLAKPGNAIGTGKLASGALDGGYDKRTPNPDAGAKGPTPGELTPQNDPRDSIYYANTAALSAQYALERGQNILTRNQAARDYERSRSEILTDRSRAKRELAESMLGTGGAYSGFHRRQQTEGDQDHLDYLDRFDTDYNRGLQQSYLEMNDIDSRLAYGTGSEYLKEMEAARTRQSEAGQDSAAEDDPLYGNKGKKKKKPVDKKDTKPNDGYDPNTGGVGPPTKPLGARIRTRNRQIRTLKAKIENTSNPNREKALRKRLQVARKQRNKLVRKAKQNG